MRDFDERFFSGGRQEGEMAKGKRGLDKRHRDKSGRIKRKHGNTRVGALQPKASART
ncbi:MAG: hypothetical protein WB495_23530 [Xanthobacteraceae bacterium]